MSSLYGLFFLIFIFVFILSLVSGGRGRRYGHGRNTGGFSSGGRDSSIDPVHQQFMFNSLHMHNSTNDFNQEQNRNTGDNGYTEGDSGCGCDCSDSNSDTGYDSSGDCGCSDSGDYGGCDSSCDCGSSDSGCSCD